MTFFCKILELKTALFLTKKNLQNIVATDAPINKR